MSQFFFCFAMSELLLGEDGGREVGKWSGTHFRSGIETMVKPCESLGEASPFCVVRDESYFPILNEERSKKPRILKITG